MSPLLNSEILAAATGLLRRTGRLPEAAGGDTSPVDPEIPANNRDSLVYGSYVPSASTSGVIDGTVLTPYNATDVDTLTLPAGTPIVNKIIYGDLRPSTLGTETKVKNCLIVGGNHVPSGQSAVVDCNAKRPGTGRLILEDCTIAPRRRSLNRDCAVGHKLTLIRCNLSGGIDGVGIFITTDKGTSADVTMLGSWVHDLSYGYPDYSNGVSGSTLHTDGSHCDCVQIQGGKNIWIKGCLLEAKATSLPGNSGPNPAKSWLEATGNANGSVVIVQDNTGAGIDETVVIEQNWLRGGLAHLNVKPNMNFVYRQNRHYDDTAKGSGWSGYYIRFDLRAGAVVRGLTDTNTNTWVDGALAGQLLAEPRASGIHYNA